MLSSLTPQFLAALRFLAPVASEQDLSDVTRQRRAWIEAQRVAPIALLSGSRQAQDASGDQVECDTLSRLPGPSLQLLHAMTPVVGLRFACSTLLVVFIAIPVVANLLIERKRLAFVVSAPLGIVVLWAQMILTESNAPDSDFDIIFGFACVFWAIVAVALYGLTSAAFAVGARVIRRWKGKTV